MNTEKTNDEVVSKPTIAQSGDIVTQPSSSPKVYSVFVKDDATVKIKVNLVFETETGTLIGVRGDNEEKLEIEALHYEPACFEFSYPKYDKIVEYRGLSSVFAPSGQLVVDGVRFRQCLLINHLRKWDIKDQDGQIIPLVTEKDGQMLSDDSLVEVNKIPAPILDVIMTRFEKRVLLSN